jgi:magnesium transporter
MINYFEKIEYLLNIKDDRALKKLLTSLDIRLVKEIINHSPRAKRKLFSLLPPELQAEVAILLSRKAKKTILPQLGNLTIARFLHFNFEDNAADILQYFPKKRQSQILEHLQPQKRGDIKKLLKYGPETAGGLMNLDFIIVKNSDSLANVKNQVQEFLNLKKTPVIIVKREDSEKILGFLPIYKLITSSSLEEPAGKHARHLFLVDANLDQEEIIKYIGKRQPIIGVMDGTEFVGVIHIEDLAKIPQREATEDIYSFAGVHKEEEALDNVSTSIKLRYKWLIVNLITALAAAFVVGLFKDTISNLVILAAYMPVVAGMGGNAGTQTLAVVVRGIALGDVTFQNSRRILMKEVLTNIANGAIIGVLVGLIAYFWNANPLLGLILLIAVMVNLFIAGLFGTIIPLSLKFLKIDPALAASVFVTAATDIFGFFVFLGLAKTFLM